MRSSCKFDIQVGRGKIEVAAVPVLSLSDLISDEPPDPIVLVYIEESCVSI
jgi:hypothetical protein